MELTLIYLYGTEGTLARKYYPTVAKENAVDLFFFIAYFPFHVVQSPMECFSDYLDYLVLSVNNIEKVGFTF